MTEIEAVQGPGEPLPKRGGRLALLFVLVIAVGIVIGLAVRAIRDDVRQIEQAQTLTNALDSLPRGPQAGAPAPDFTVELLDGSTFRLSEHLASDGRPVLLNFWYPSCPPCRAEMPALDQVARATPEVLFLGIGVPILDTKEDAIAFSEEIAVSYPLGWDETEVVSALYPTLGYPTTYIVGSDGTIIRQFIGIVSAEWLTELLAQDLNL